VGTINSDYFSEAVLCLLSLSSNLRGDVRKNLRFQ
jgi:hypothetical protein